MSKSLTEHCVEIGRFGGLSKSDKKRAAARANLAKARKAKQAKESFARQEQAVKPQPWQKRAW